MLRVLLMVVVTLVVATAVRAEDVAVPEAKTFKVGDCREFDRAIMKDDKEIIVPGKLCLQEDGSWVVVE